MQMIFLSRRPLSPSFCLRCLSADKRKRMPILFCLPRGSFFFFLLLSPSPRIYRHFCFLAPTPYSFISSARAPLRWLLSCENAVMRLQWIVRTVSPSNLISFGRDCSSPHQEVPVALHLHIYFCSTVDICKRGTSRLRMVKSKKSPQKSPERIQSSAAQSWRRAHT